MKNTEECGTSMTEIIFAGRNKAYGAYELRTSYPETVFKSLVIVTAICASLSVSAYLLTNELPEKKPDLIPPDQTIVHVTPFKPLEPEAAVKDERKPHPQPSANNSLPNQSITVSDSVTSSEVKKETKGESPSTLTISGAIGKPGDAIDSSDAGEIKTVKVKRDFELDRLPEFEGGLEGLHRFLRSQLTYPPLAREEGIQGTVYVSFVVDEDCNLSDFTLLNKPGYGLDDEALRVTRKIPKFKKPGMAGGKPVKAYYQVPIRFQIR